MARILSLNLIDRTIAHRWTSRSELRQVQLDSRGVTQSADRRFPTVQWQHKDLRPRIQHRKGTPAAYRRANQRAWLTPLRSRVTRARVGISVSTSSGTYQFSS